VVWCAGGHVGPCFRAGAALDPMQAARAAQAAQAAARGRGAAGVVPAGAAPQELFRRPGRFHSRLQNIEYECWVHERALPPPARLQVRCALGWARLGAEWAAEEVTQGGLHVVLGVLADPGCSGMPWAWRAERADHAEWHLVGD
jgi:hypothetical protein